MNVTFEATPIGSLPDLDAVAASGSRSARIDATLRPAFVTHGAGSDNLERLFAPDALCVTTGQQPGLFTGPLFTIYKAATAVTLAREFETRLERPVVPVFWVAGDDHDFAEANHVQVLTASQEIERLVLRERDAADPLVPLYREPLGGNVEPLLTALREATPETEFRSGIFKWLGSHYRADRDFASAFAGALAELFARHGLVVFCPTQVEAKRVMAPFLIAALEHGAALDVKLRDHAEELERTGKPAPVAVGDGTTLVMIEGQLGRDRLVLNGERFVARRSGEAWTLADLQAVAQEEPNRLSPNVLLRPVIEGAILPTLAYVAGPSELEYFPQCQPIYAALDVSAQEAVPRWSGRLLEARVGKVLTKYNLAPEDLSGSEGQLEAALVAEQMPAEAKTALAALITAVEAEYERLEHAAAEVDPTLRKSVRSARNQALANLSDIDKRIVGRLKKQNSVVVRQVANARMSLFPAGRAQERVFNVAPYLVRYGLDLVDTILDATASWIGKLESAPRET